MDEPTKLTIMLLLLINVIKTMVIDNDSNSKDNNYDESNHKINDTSSINAYNSNTRGRHIPLTQTITNNTNNNVINRMFDLE